MGWFFNIKTNGFQLKVHVRGLYLKSATQLSCYQYNVYNSEKFHRNAQGTGAWVAVSNLTMSPQERGRGQSLYTSSAMSIYLPRRSSSIGIKESAGDSDKLEDSYILNLIKYF